MTQEMPREPRRRFLVSSKRKILIVALLTLSLAITVIPLINFSKPLSSSSRYVQWNLMVEGFVQDSLNLTIDELSTMLKTTVYAELFCVDNPNVPITKGNWTGVRLALLLERAGVSQGAVKVAFFAEDGYTTDLTVTAAIREDVIVAYEKNSEPLLESLRLVVPGKWGYKWISRLIRIELVNYDFKGRWESLRYSDEADVQSNP